MFFSSYFPYLFLSTIGCPLPPDQFQVPSHMSEKSMLDNMPYNMSTKGMLDMPPFSKEGGFSMAMDLHRTDFSSPGIAIVTPPQILIQMQWQLRVSDPDPY